MLKIFKIYEIYKEIWMVRSKDNGLSPYDIYLNTDSDRIVLLLEVREEPSPFFRRGIIDYHLKFITLDGMIFYFICNGISDSYVNRKKYFKALY